LQSSKMKDNAPVSWFFYRTSTHHCLTKKPSEGSNSCDFFIDIQNCDVMEKLTFSLRSTHLLIIGLLPHHLSSFTRNNDHFLFHKEEENVLYTTSDCRRLIKINEIV
jgi:hypothetical protein